MSQSHSPSGRSVQRARVVTVIGFVGIALVAFASPLWAQAKKPPAKPAEKAFEDVMLDTKDGVIIHCTYYPGPEKKTTVPLILLHDWDGSRTDLHTLANFLQQTLGHAVIVPDLRGHGTSVRLRNSEKPIERDKMNKLGIESMMLDVEAVKSYLLQRNNEEKLNIEQLGVLGVGFGGTLALNWAVRDWQVRNLPTYKMGQDVKALILISPRQTFKGVNVNPALKNSLILSRISLLLAVGTQDAARHADAKRIFKAFEGARGDDVAERDKDAVRMYEADTTLQGIDLLYDRELRVPEWIAGCIKTRLVDRATDFPWTDRTSPLK
jgi:pimeloyl-ACP methyl ester carboxylesterase